MKTIKLIITGIFLTVFSLGVFAQSDSPPDPPGHGETGDITPPGGGAPVSGGILILLGLGAVYGAKKTFELTQEEKR